MTKDASELARELADFEQDLRDKVVPYIESVGGKAFFDDNGFGPFTVDANVAKRLDEIGKRLGELGDRICREGTPYWRTRHEIVSERLRQAQMRLDALGVATHHERGGMDGYMVGVRFDVGEYAEATDDAHRTLLVDHALRLVRDSIEAAIREHLASETERQKPPPTNAPGRGRLCP